MAKFPRFKPKTFYHGTYQSKVPEILKSGLVAGRYTGVSGHEHAYLSPDKEFALNHSPHREYAVEFDIPKDKVFEGNNEIDWMHSGKPVWHLAYMPEIALTRGGVPRKYLKAVIVRGVRTPVGAGK